MSAAPYPAGSRRRVLLACAALSACGVASAQVDLPPYDAVACAAARQGASVVVNGSAVAGHMGFSVDASADWDGDGFDDVLVSGGADTGTGRVWLFFGPNLSLWVKFVIPNFHNELNRLGPSVAFIGDVNGGGKVDLAIGDPFWINTKGTPTTSDDVHDAGRVFVFFGEDRLLPGTTITLDETTCEPDIILEYDGPDPMWFGASLAGGNFAGSFADPYASPVHVPQFSDLIVGAPVRQDVTDLPGKAFVFLGGPHDPGAQPPLLALAGPCGAAGQCAGQLKPVRIQATQCAFRQLTGLSPRDRFGFAVGATGTISPALEAGYQSVLIGAPQGEFTLTDGLTPFVSAFTDVSGNELPGYAEVWSAFHNWQLLPSPAKTGKVVSLFGWSVSRAGDVDGDGIEDLLVGAPGYGDPPGGSGPPVVNSGAVYVYSGKLDATVSYPLLAGPLTLSTLSNATDPTGTGDLLGFSLAGRIGHDVDGDGRDDFVVGLNVATNPDNRFDVCACHPTGGLQSGRAYVCGFAGADFHARAYAVYRGEAQRDGFGWAVSIGNIFHLGTANELDVVAGAPRNSTVCFLGTEDGELDVFAGENIVVP